MPRSTPALVALVATLFAAGQAVATDRFKGEGVTLRLVADRPGTDGGFRAALLVDLDPGWKTYWLDPGEAGIPPELDFSASRGVEAVDAFFPAPHRFDDGFAKSMVYSGPFAVALAGRLSPPARLDVKVTLGVCRDICIPIAAKLDADFDAPDDGLAVAAAFAALPKPSTASEGVVGAVLSPDGKTLDVSVSPPGIAESADVFAVGERGWFFGMPAPAERTGPTAIFRLPVVARPRKAAGAPFAARAILAGPHGDWSAERLTLSPTG